MAGIFGAKANFYVVGVSAMCFLITPLPMYLIDRLGRRPLLLFSSTTMGCAAITLGFCFKYQDSLWGVQHTTLLDGVSFAASLVYGMAFSFGAGPITFLLISELAPARVRGLASSIVQAINWMIVFGLSEIGGWMQIVLGDDGMFFMVSTPAIESYMQ